MPSQRVRLTFPPERVTEPVIYNIGHQFKIVTNIRRANVTKDAGWVILEMSGDESELEQAMDYLRKTGIEVEPIEGDIVES
jgi:ABC-type methionine transport system ATPase subunit